MTDDEADLNKAADRLAELFIMPFAGKAKGRYRISAKLVSDLAGRRRLYESDIQTLTRAMFERGFVLVDMGSYFAVLSAGGFVNFRRANADCLK